MLMHEVKGADAESHFLQEKEERCLTRIADMDRGIEKSAYTIALRALLEVNMLTTIDVYTSAGIETYGVVDGGAYADKFVKAVEEHPLP